MPRSMQYTEVSVGDAEKCISEFFHNNQELIDTFNAVCVHMSDFDKDLIVRTNGEIIGLSKHNELYRFYISKKDGEYFIKYKNRKEIERFFSSDVELYFGYNKSCIDFFEENKDSFIERKRRKDERTQRAESRQKPSSRISENEIAEAWAPVKAKAENSVKFVTKSSSSTEYLDKAYHEITELFSDICSSPEFLTERDADIIKSRIVKSPTVTLQDLGVKYGVSRERIRQREQSAWSRLTVGIYRGRREKYIPYRERLKCLLLSIPDEFFINTIVQIYHRNPSIGMWLQMVVSGADDKSDIALAIKKAVFSSQKTAKSSACIPPEVINKIKDTVDIVEYISSWQKVVFKGESYRTYCPFCGTTDALVIDSETKSFRCSSCTTGGDVITYLMKVDDLDYKSAVSVLSSSSKNDSFLQERADFSQMMREAALYYYSQLKNNARASTAIDILHSWGIWGKAIVQLGLGFHDKSYDSFIKYMTREKSYSIMQLEKANLAVQSAKGNYVDGMMNSIVIPTIDENGNVVCFDSYNIERQRLFQYPKNQYFERSKNLYSYNLAIKSEKKSVIVVTAYKDYFKLIGFGVTNVVSTYRHKITEAQLALLERKFKALILIAEADFQEKICSEYCRKHGMHFDRIDLQNYASVVEYIENNLQKIIGKVDEYEHALI